MEVEPAPPNYLDRSNATERPPGDNEGGCAPFWTPKDLHDPDVLCELVRQMEERLPNALKLCTAKTISEVKRIYGANDPETGLPWDPTVLTQAHLYTWNKILSFELFSAGPNKRFKDVDLPGAFWRMWRGLSGMVAPPEGIDVDCGGRGLDGTGERRVTPDPPVQCLSGPTIAGVRLADQVPFGAKGAHLIFGICMNGTNSHAGQAEDTLYSLFIRPWEVRLQSPILVFNFNALICLREDREDMSTSRCLDLTSRKKTRDLAKFCSRMRVEQLILFGNGGVGKGTTVETVLTIAAALPEEMVLDELRLSGRHPDLEPPATVLGAGPRGFFDFEGEFIQISTDAPERHPMTGPLNTGAHFAKLAGTHPGSNNAHSLSAARGLFEGHYCQAMTGEPQNPLLKQRDMLRTRRSLNVLMDSQDLLDAFYAGKHPKLQLRDATTLKTLVDYEHDAYAHKIEATGARCVYKTPVGSLHPYTARFGRGTNGRPTFCGNHATVSAAIAALKLMHENKFVSAKVTRLAALDVAEREKVERKARSNAKQRERTGRLAAGVVEGPQDATGGTTGGNSHDDDENSSDGDGRFDSDEDSDEDDGHNGGGSHVFTYVHHDKTYDFSNAIFEQLPLDMDDESSPSGEVTADQTTAEAAAAAAAEAEEQAKEIEHVDKMVLGQRVKQMTKREVQQALESERSAA